MYAAMFIRKMMQEASMFRHESTFKPTRTIGDSGTGTDAAPPPLLFFAAAAVNEAACF
jgi:hypothetical protein